MKVSIIVPIHNEEKTLENIIKKLVDIDLKPWIKEIIFINDGSTDRTVEILEKHFKKFNMSKVHLLINHSRNRGKGAAIKSGLSQATGEYILIQDADLEYDPLDIPNLLKVIGKSSLGEKKTGKLAVFGNRGVKRYPERGFHYVLGAKILTWTVDIIYRVNIHDLYTGYKLLPRELVKSFNLESTGFEFEAEVACKLIKSGCTIVEVPISYKPRSKKEGKHINYKDFFKGFVAILKYI